jgi:hypothetical protein
MKLMAQQSQDVQNQEYIEVMPDSGLANEMLRMVKALEAKVAADNFETVDGEAARRLFAAMIKVYSLRTEAGERDLPVNMGDSGTNATDLMITASAILRSGDLEVFELGMWQSYTQLI